MNETTAGETGIPREARRWAMICHVIALAGLVGNGIGFIIAPLIVWLIKKDEHPFIDEQGKESLNFQITMFMALIVSGILIFFIIGIVLVPAVLLLMIILPIVAAIKANEGEAYRYPLSIRLIK